MQFPRDLASVPLEGKQMNRNGFQAQAKEASGKERDTVVQIKNHVRRNSTIKTKTKKMVHDAKYSILAGGQPLKRRLKNRGAGTENPSLKSASESKSDNESATNNIKSFTQNASINESNGRTMEQRVAQDALKSQGRPRVDSGRLVVAQYSGTTGSHNETHRITRFKELFNILGIQSFDATDNTFEFGEKAYRLDLSELLKDLTVVRVKKHNSNN